MLNNTDMTDIINSFKLEKKKMNLTNATLAEITGIPLGTLNKILSGDSKDPQISAIIKISRALDVSADYIVFGKEALDSKDRGIHMYKQLDIEDKAFICGEMKQMLKADKYATGTTSTTLIAAKGSAPTKMDTTIEQNIAVVKAVQSLRKKNRR